MCGRHGSTCKADHYELFSQKTGTPLSAGILQAGALMIVLYALSTLTTGILQGLGQLKQPLVNCSIALVIHFIALYFLLTAANLNIYAVIYSNILFALLVCILNAACIRRFIHYRQEWYKTFVVPAIASIIMGAAVYLVYSVFHLFAGNTISTVIAILMGVVVYGVGLVSFKGISIDEIAMFPKGHLIIKVLHRSGLVNKIGESYEKQRRFER